MSNHYRAYRGNRQCESVNPKSRERCMLVSGHAENHEALWTIWAKPTGDKQVSNVYKRPKAARDAASMGARLAQTAARYDQLEQSHADLLAALRMCVQCLAAEFTEDHPALVDGRAAIAEAEGK